MEKDSKLTYDEAITKAESIIIRLEQSDAISMEEYQKAATEASALLRQCQNAITRYSENA